MGAKISKRGSYKLRKKSKGEKIERQTSVISLTDAQIYEDFFDNVNQSEEVPQATNVPEENDFALQMEREFNEHLKEVCEVSQNNHPVLIDKTSTTTLYHDVFEDDSFYDALSVGHDEKTEHNEREITESLENWAIESLGDHANEETIVYFTPPHHDSSTTNNERNVVDTSVSLENQTEESHQNNSESPVQANEYTALDFVPDHNLVVCEQNHVHPDPGSSSSDEELQALASAHLDPIIHVVTKEYTSSDSESSKSVATSDEDRLNFQTSNNAPKEETTEEKPKRISLSTKFFAEANDKSYKYNDDFLIASLDTTTNGNTLLNEDHIEESTSNQLPEEFEVNDQSTRENANKNIPSEANSDKINTNLDTIQELNSVIENANNNLENEDDSDKTNVKSDTIQELSSGIKNANKNEDNSDETNAKSDTIQELNSGIKIANKNEDNSDETNANSDTIKELKSIIESINNLERKINNSDAQDTYQTLIKIMMQVNHVKNEDFDEEILNLQNTALNQINLCLKILKKQKKV